jgi:hypothetical protein
MTDNFDRLNAALAARRAAAARTPAHYAAAHSCGVYFSSELLRRLAADAACAPFSPSSPGSLEHRLKLSSEAARRPGRGP